MTHSRPYDSDPPSHLRRSARGRGANDDIDELNFDDPAPPRSGDPVHSAELASTLPLQRERNAGLSGGELPRDARDQSDITDDDLSPETLYDEEDEYELYVSQPADKQLRSARPAEIGAGFGKDEAELARQEHPGP